MRFFAFSPLFARYIEIVVCQVIGRFYLWEIRCSSRAFRTNRTREIKARIGKSGYCPILIFTLSLLSEIVIREMAKKITRLEALRVILSNKVVRSQADIQRELARAGFKVSQPTVSSDLQKLHALRQKTPDGYQLILPKTEGYRRPIPIEALPEYLQNTGVVGITFSGTLAVLHTRPGYAAGLAADIDSHHLPEVAGTVAGYDTLFVAKAEGIERQQLIDALSSVIPALKAVLL